MKLLLRQNDKLAGLISGRVFVQIGGSTPETVVPMPEEMYPSALVRFDL